MRAAFDLFSESFLALSGCIQWELVFKPQTAILRGSTMPALPFMREHESPTNPSRIVSQVRRRVCWFGKVGVGVRLRGYGG